MKAYLGPVEGKPPVPLTRSRWRRFLEYKMPLVTLYLMVAILIGVLLAPFVLVTVPSGYAGVVWKRFRLEQQSEPDDGLRTTGGANEWIMTRLLALSKEAKTPTILDCTPMQVFEPHGSSALCSSSCLSWQ